jgi:hypothetical protein
MLKNGYLGANFIRLLVIVILFKQVNFVGCKPSFQATNI